MLPFMQQVQSFFIKQFRVFFKNLSHFDGHRTVNKSHQMRNAVFAQKTIQMIEQFLRAFDGEAGNHNVAAGFMRFVNDTRELGGDVFCLTMHAVPVGGFNQHIVRFLKLIRIINDGNVPSPDIAGKKKSAALIVLLDGQPDTGGAENMTRFAELGGDSVGHRNRLMIGRGLHQRNSLLDIPLRIERLIGERTGFTLFFMAGFFMFNVLLLQEGGIFHNNLRNFSRSRRAENVTGKSFFNQLGQPTAMVEMSVREQHSVDRFRRHRKIIPVSLLQVAFLIKPAVDQNPCSGGFHQIARTGYILSRPEKTEF